MRPDSIAVLILVALVVVSPLALLVWLADSSQDRAILGIVELHGAPDRITDADANYTRRVEYRTPDGRVKAFVVLVNGRVVESIR